MKILLYKRTHIGDPDHRRQFGNEGCMGRVRGFNFEAVIGIGGVSGQPTEQGISGKLNWIGRNPQKSQNPIDPRGPLISFSSDDFRLFEHRGPLLSSVAPLLHKKVFGSRARFIFLSLSAAERQEAERLIERVLDLKEFDRMQLRRATVAAGEETAQKSSTHVICETRGFTPCRERRNSMARKPKC